MTAQKCPTCGQSCSWLLKSERWRCWACSRFVDAPPPPAVAVGQGDAEKTWPKESK